ncbi:MAG: hypothetical protein ACOX6B_07250 [Thermoguttaceae bacterium]|jgi:hypothetical protein
MGNWRFTTFMGDPKAWCFDLGEIKRFVPFGLPEDDNEPLKDFQGIVEAEGGEFVYGRARKAVLRIGGYDIICRKDLDLDLNSRSLYLPDDIEPGDEIDPKDIYDYVYYRGSEIGAWCSDPRFLAIGNLQFDAWRAKIPYKKIRKIFENPPTREAANRYLQKNDYTWREPLAPWQVQYVTEERWRTAMGRTGDYTPLLEGE